MREGAGEPCLTPEPAGRGGSPESRGTEGGASWHDFKTTEIPRTRDPSLQGPAGSRLMNELLSPLFGLALALPGGSSCLCTQESQWLCSGGTEPGRLSIPPYRLAALYVWVSSLSVSKLLTGRLPPCSRIPSMPARKVSQKTLAVCLSSHDVETVVRPAKVRRAATVPGSPVPRLPLLHPAPVFLGSLIRNVGPQQFAVPPCCRLTVVPPG